VAGCELGCAALEKKKWIRRGDRFKAGVANNIEVIQAQDSLGAAAKPTIKSRRCTASIRRARDLCALDWARMEKVYFRSEGKPMSIEIEVGLENANKKLVRWWKKYRWKRKRRKGLANPKGTAASDRWRRRFWSAAVVGLFLVLREPAREHGRRAGSTDTSRRSASKIYGKVAERID